MIQPRQIKITSQKSQSLNYSNPPASSATHPPVSVSFQGQQLPLELITSHNIKHWVQAAAYTAHGLKEFIGGIENVGVRWCDLIMDSHAYQSDDHDVVGHEGDHKDQYGGSDEPQRLPPCPLRSSVPSTPRQASQNANCHDVKNQHEAER